MRFTAVVECLTWDRVSVGSSLTGATALCPWARHINPSLVMVLTSKTHPYITERLLMWLMANKVLLLSLLNSVDQKMLSWRFVLCKCLVYVPLSYFDKPAPLYGEAGRIKNSSLPSSNMRLPFAGRPIVVSFNVLSGTLSKTNDFTKHAHELNLLKFYSVFNLSGQYQGRFWLVCSIAQSSQYMRWSPMIKKHKYLLSWLNSTIRPGNPTIYKHGYLRSVRMTSSCLKMARLP